MSVDSTILRPPMIHEEDAHQKALIKWAGFVTINGFKVIDYLFAIPNGGKRNAREAGRIKAQGGKAGISDLMLAIPNKSHHGLWIEMKSRTGTPTALQLEWGERMQGVGYQFNVCHSSTEAQSVIEQYLNNKGVEMAELKPRPDTGGMHCDTSCPYLDAWDHPFWHYSGWCWHLMKDLSWDDSWLAKCRDEEPDEKLASMRGSGFKFKEWSKRAAKQ